MVSNDALWMNGGWVGAMMGVDTAILPRDSQLLSSMRVTESVVMALKMGVVLRWLRPYNTLPFTSNNSSPTWIWPDFAAG